MKHRSLRRYAINSWNWEITHVFVMLKRLFFLMHSLKLQFHIRQQLCLRSGGCLLYSSGRLDYFSDWILAPYLYSSTNVLIQFKTHLAYFSEKPKFTFFSQLEKKSFVCYGCFGKNRLVIICFISIMSFTCAWILKDNSVKNWYSDLNTGNTIKISHLELNWKYN